MVLIVADVKFQTIISSGDVLRRTVQNWSLIQFKKRFDDQKAYFQKLKGSKIIIQSHFTFLIFCPIS
jgi:hypothetical protein